MSGLRLLLLVLAVIDFVLMIIIGFWIHSAGLSLADWFGMLGVGLSLFAASFLPLP